MNILPWMMFLLVLVLLLSRRRRAWVFPAVAMAVALPFLVALVLVGILLWCLLLSHSRPVEPKSFGQLSQAEMALAGDLSAGYGMGETLHLVKLLEAPNPPEAPTVEERPKPESPKKASADDETTSTKETEPKERLPDDNRPDWVGGKPFKEGGVYKVPVTVGPWPNAEEALKRLPAVVEQEIAKYAVSRAGHQAAAKLTLPVDYVMTHMIKDDRWEEPVKIDSFDDVKHMVGRDVWENAEGAADGRWTQLHVLVKFDDEVNRRLDDGWDRLSRVERLVGAGVMAGIVLIILGAVYCYLKIDLKTGGAYRVRLRAAALAAILAFVLAILLNRG